MANIIRFGDGASSNKDILNLDSPPSIAKSKRAGELTGNTSDGLSNYDVKVNGTKIFSVVSHTPNISEITTKLKLACTSIGGYGLQNCTGLTQLDLPACTSIGTNGLSQCTSLTQLDLPACTSIGTSGLYSCTGLTQLDLPACISIGIDALYSCTGLTQLDLPACTSIGGYGLQNCTGLTQLDLPACTSIGTSGLYSCTGLTQLTIGANIQTIDNDAFYNTKSGIVITINRAQNAVSGAPWGASNATIHWIGDA